ncbi:hypothetical protein RYX36_008149 [Vicia faba]
MGNSLPSNGHIKVRNNATITFKRVENKEVVIGGHREKWQVKYIIDKSDVRLDLDRVFDKDGIANSLRLQFDYSGRRGEAIFFFIDKLENDQLEKIKFQKLGKFYDTKVDSEIYDSWGFVTKTNAFFFGGGRGLVVTEEKSMYKGMNPYNVTVAHYYADCSRDDIGLSMILDISVSNNNLVVSVEGPIQHSSSSLFRMFKQVSKIRIWKRAISVETQTRVYVGAFIGLDNELECENDREENTYNLPPTTQLHYSSHNRRSLVSNQGAIRGNNNGNVIFNQYNLIGE